MKHITVFLLCIFLLSPVLAQRWVDIEIIQVAPANNFTYEQGDDFPVSLIIKNMGPDTLFTSDSIAIRFINEQKNSLIFKNGTAYSPWIGIGAKKLAAGDTMHIDTIITASTMVPSQFFKGNICIDAYPCADSIGSLWNCNMDTLVNNNVNCRDIYMFPVSVIFPDKQHVVSIYPNPVTNILNINIRNVQGANVAVRNSVGTVIGIATETKSGNFIFNTANLSPGIYYVEVLSDSGTKSMKFIKL